jgi:hypothetical protein
MGGRGGGDQCVRYLLLKLILCPVVFKFKLLRKQQTTRVHGVGVEKAVEFEFEFELEFELELEMELEME